MSDLLDQDSVDAFVSAMRDVSDTFNRYPVTLCLESGDREVLAGKKDITSEVQAREEGADVDEAFTLVFNRTYLDEEGLIDEDGPVFGYDTDVMIDGKRFVVQALAEKPVFRDVPLSVVMEVAR